MVAEGCKRQRGCETAGGSGNRAWDDKWTNHSTTKKRQHGTAHGVLLCRDRADETAWSDH